ncbi:MAG: hypothetical protein H0T84_12215 [Tatlockia sp.]|nr:hypothetical protein [Tatlockia sp.]
METKVDNDLHLQRIQNNLDQIFQENYSAQLDRDLSLPNAKKIDSIVSFSKHAQKYLREILAPLKTKEELYTAILAIDERFQREKSKGDEQINQKIELLKNEIINSDLNTDKNPYRNWKDVLLNIDSSYQPISCTFLEQKRIYPDIEKPISLTNEERFKTSRKKNVCTISGSSFATDNTKQRLEDTLDESGKPKESAILDASYTASISDGWVIAVTDGCGHHDTEIKNEAIGRTSYFAAKNACRLMAGYADADSLRKNLHELKERVNKELPVKVRAHRNQSLRPRNTWELDKTTLACGRAFHMDNGNFRFVGLNIGDSMLITYNSRSKSFETIAKARQIFRGFGHASPAALPGLCMDNEVVTFDVSLPEGSIVFGLTDGVWDYLPTQENSDENQDLNGFIETEIDFTRMMADTNFKLPRQVTASRLTKAIADYSLYRTEQERINRIAKAVEAKLSEPTLKSDLLRLQTEGKDAYNPEVQEVLNKSDQAFKAQQVTVGDDYTLVGMALTDKIDLTPDYTAGEIAASILTLGLYALIKDCLHIGTEDEITIADGFGAAAATFGFFATGSLVGLGYLAYKGIQELTSSNEGPK